jgi:hypothetical protein
VSAVVAALAMDRWLFDLPTTSTSQTIVKFGYPTTDALLLGAAVAIVLLTKPARWASVLPLALGMALFAVTDIRYYTLTTNGVVHQLMGLPALYTPGDVVDFGYVAALAVIGLGAWWAGRGQQADEYHRVPLPAPVLGLGAAIAVLVVGMSADISPVPVVLAVATIVLSAVRVVLSPRLNPAPEPQGAPTTV